MTRHALLALAALLLAGCQTTQQTTILLNDSWAGAPADRFFVRNGAPVSEFKLANGGTIYGWRGGEQSITITETIREEDPFEEFRPRYRRPGLPRYAINPETGEERRVFPADPFPEFRNERIVSRRETVFCEADIATDRRDRIINITIRKDTRGVGLSSSRCAEIFPND
jgi:hypothetical protein